MCIRDRLSGDYDVQVRTRRIDGAPFDVRVQARVIPGACGMAEMYAVLSDVTEEVREQRKRAWQNERYRLLSELAHAISFDYDSESDTVLLYLDRTGKGMEEQVITHYLAVSYTHLDVYKRQVHDLGRQRHVAVRVGEVHHRARARLQALAWSHEHFPTGAMVVGGGAGGPQEEHLGRTACAPLRAQKARWHDARLVRHQQVAGAQVLRDVAEDAVLQGPGRPVHDEQAASIPLGRRLLSEDVYKRQG